MKSKLFVFAFSFGVIFSFAQSFSAYKYVLVPEQFDGFSHPNQFNLNRYASIILKQNGFTVINPNVNEWPRDAQKNPCLILNYHLSKEKSFFRNKVKTSFVNCKKETIMETEGVSPIKEFARGFKDALRVSMKKFLFENYAFNESLAFSLSENSVALNELEKIPEPKSLVNIVRTEDIKLTKTEHARFYTFEEISLKEEVITADKVLFVSPNNPNVILVRGTVSSLKGVYNVVFSSEENQKITTIGYFEQGNWVMDLPDHGKTIFKKKTE